MDESRQFETLFMGAGEQIARPITVPASWGSSPSAPITCKLFDGSNDVSDDNLSGTATVSGAVITTQLIGGLTSGKKYKLTVSWADSGNTLEAWCWVICE